MGTERLQFSFAVPCLWNDPLVGWNRALQKKSGSEKKFFFRTFLHCFQSTQINTWEPETLFYSNSFMKLKLLGTRASSLQSLNLKADVLTTEPHGPCVWEFCLLILSLGWLPGAGVWPGLWLRTRNFSRSEKSFFFGHCRCETQKWDVAVLLSLSQTNPSDKPGFAKKTGSHSPPARWGLLDFMSVACSSPPLLSSSSCSTATLDAQCSLSDLNHDHPRPVFPAGPQPRPSPPSVPCRTSTTTIHAQCSLPDLNREYPRQVFPAGPHVGRYGTKNVQKKVRKNVRQVCYILLANSRACGRVTGPMPLLTLQVAKFEAISLNRWQSHWGGQRHFHFCTFGAVCKDAWDRQHLTASYYKLLEVISCWIDAWDSQHHTGFLLCITAMVAWWICDIGTFVGAFEPSSTRSRARGRMDIIIEEFSRRLCDQ